MERSLTFSYSPIAARLAVLWIREVEPAARVPLRALVAVGGNAARVLEHPRQMEDVPRREGGVAVREVVLRSSGSRVEIRRARAGLADPARIGLRWNHVAEVLQRVQGVHRAVFDPILVARHQAAADPAVVG